MKAVTLRTTLITGLVLVAVSAGGTGFFLSRAQRKASAAELALLRATQKIDAARAQVADFEESRALSPAAIAEADSVLEALIPANARLPEELLVRAAGWAAVAGVKNFREALPEGKGPEDELERLRLQLEGGKAPERKGSTDPTVTVEFEFDADLRGLLRFLEEVRRSPQWVEVVKLDVGAGETPHIRMRLAFHFLRPKGGA